MPMGTLSEVDEQEIRGAESYSLTSGPIGYSTPAKSCHVKTWGQRCHIYHSSRGTRNLHCI